MIFPPLRRAAGARYFARTKQSSLALGREFFRGSQVIQIFSPRRASTKFPRETRGEGLAFCQRDNFSSRVRAICTCGLFFHLSLFLSPDFFYYFKESSRDLFLFSVSKLFLLLIL